MSISVSKYVQHHLVDVAENQRKLNEKRKPGTGPNNASEAGVEENLATITEETVKNMIDSKYYNSSDAELSIMLAMASVAFRRRRLSHHVDR